MRNFICKILLFVVLQASVFAFLLKNYDVSSETNFFARIVEKHERLDAISPPRIILLGGSNVPFGFQSDVMESALGRPVVNMGLAAGVGVEFMLADIEPELRAGDIVTLSLEYDHFARGRRSGGEFDPSALQQILIYRPQGILALRPIHFRKIVLDRGLILLGEIARQSLRSRVAAKPPPASEEISPRAAFNKWGDLVGHRNKPSPVSPQSIEGLPLLVWQPDFPNKAVLRHLSGFVRRCKARGIRVTFSFPPKPIATLARERARAEQVEQALAQIPDLILLDKPADHAYPADQFFDSANHLTAQGSATRTAKVIAELRPLVESFPREQQKRAPAPDR